MRPNTIHAIRDACVRVMGRDPMAAGATPEAMKKELETHLQTEGAKVRAARERARKKRTAG
jgi:hypothetical protein